MRKDWGKHKTAVRTHSCSHSSRRPYRFNELSSVTFCGIVRIAKLTSGASHCDPNLASLESENPIPIEIASRIFLMLELRHVRRSASQSLGIDT